MALTGKTVAGSRRSDPYDREVGLRIRSLRLSRRMSQTDLGDRLGLTFQQIQKYEKGQNRIAAGRLLRLAEIFQVPVSTLFGARGSAARGGKAPFEFIGVSGAVRLLEAYGGIRDGAVRRALLRLAEEIALTSRRSSRD